MLTDGSLCMDGSFSMFTLDCIPRRMPHSNSLSSLATLHSTLGYPSTPDAFARLLLSIATPQHPTHHTQLVHSHSATPFGLDGTHSSTVRADLYGEAAPSASAPQPTAPNHLPHCGPVRVYYGTISFAPCFQCASGLISCDITCTVLHAYNYF
ncbi:hypothetical protein CNAG_06956 [Cryptococcus neoformans var. grubii H99]|uniref:Uncharacterized protein n=2 Tax=Cryptococcus neoformans TaxID=5207 RepID=J9VXR9_CRYN9|nr:hypothetical protein CNAG_06956 [Cryptococcus neoformans var. grubii H99]AFR98216.1 hypothetical protein CNAG_06956 [Cryptococcus neoformans var. grubii H99]AUB28328.1 hypothetical protein CKF44_06956 [Cryptococcus neoformans var. grubii]|eukprot:XP_012052912.1 hypothetical protein CNAG_06956 [Cryptococcus neoformans var. grubii H99]